MQKISALAFLVLVGLWASAQSYNPDKIKPKALDQYDQAVEYLKAGEIREAIPVLQNCLVIDSNYVDAYLSLAAAYGQLKQYAASIKLYEKARSKDSLYFKLYQLPYSINLAGAGRFQDALAQVEDFILLPNLGDRSKKAAQYRNRCYSFALDYCQQHILIKTNTNFYPSI